MKLIIDIPDHIYSMVTNTGTFGCYRFNTSKAIRQGVPLDKIRAEIEEYKSRTVFGIGIKDLETGKQVALDNVLGIIDKYKAESEDKECQTSDQN